MKFGSYLRGLREAKGWSVRQMAGMIHVHGRQGIEHSYLSKLERSELENPSEELLEALAGVLGVNPHLMAAMAGKVTKSLQEAMQRYPEEFAALLGSVEAAPKQDLQNIVQAARAVRDGTW